ncbi:MAG: hypothetical protein A3K19_00250 [Lentisphaerae bacterium RIFOXYB12_FULL_65_16]|nr:MAG: hypothetical protein A3K18_04855 [Lentisphaerae bacterium RIFOXYA12_64_32]OGV85404.1 MAG: hypothetical protein A3K19_00250 [Lentisphaerae bacterium RIFOXYB12_FULL_65_16]
MNHSSAKVVTRAEIATALRQLGLGAGDIVLLHSALSSIGAVEDGAAGLVGAFLDVLGPQGTLVVPTFGALGVVTDTVKTWPNAVSSVHPAASVAAVGAAARELCAEHWKAELAHGPDTPYTRIADKGGYVCLLGVDQDRNTTLHTVEELLRLPYLKTTAEKTFDTPEGKVTKSWPFFPGPHRDFIGVDRALRERGLMTMGRIGDAVVRLVRSRDLIERVQAMVEQDPALFLCDNPACDDCVLQRADLRRHQLKRESFQAAVSASLAGRYAQEIADVVWRAGFAAVELDSIEGRPVSTAPRGKVTDAAAVLRKAGLAITALRLPAAVDDIRPMADLARECGVSRLIIPLSSQAAAHVRTASEAQVNVSFVNLGVSSQLASRLLVELRDTGLTPCVTFNAANFARAGEKPFLSSYKQKLRRFVDQLDIEDATFAGCPTDLARGNAEIKEMMSILRCANFPGVFCLTGANRAVSNLTTVAARFMTLLREM